MSIRGDFDAGLAGEFIKSLIEERDFAPQNSIAVVAASSTFAAQFPIIIEATQAIGGGHFSGNVSHQHRHVLQGYRFASIFGGDAGIGNNVPVVAVPGHAAPAISRYYVRIRGRFPLVPDSLVWTEGVSDADPIGAIAMLQGGGIVPTRSLSIEQVSHPDNQFPFDITQPIGGLILNREMEVSHTADPAIRLLDRVVAFSVNEALGGGNISMRYIPGFFRLSAGTDAFYQGGPQEYIEWTGNPDLNVLLGPRINSSTGDLIPESSDATNPPSLLAPHQPMIGAAIGAPSQTIYLECMFLGSVPETAARPEEYFELAEPISLS